MIVQCPSCSKRYRVNDANIPPSGGKIRCPECSHAFVVYPQGQASGPGFDDPADKTAIGQAPKMQELLRGMKEGADHDAQEVAKTEVMPGSELPDFNNLFRGGDDADQTTEMQRPLAPDDDLATQQLDSDVVDRSMQHLHSEGRQGAQFGGGDKDATQIAPPPNRDQQATAPPDPSQQRRVSAPSGPTPPPGNFESGPTEVSSGSSPGGTPGSMGAPAAQGGGGGPDPNHQGPWKLKTNFGLTYEFADSDSLRNWLESRDELDGYELSADGSQYYPLDQFPQVQRAPTRSGANAQIASSGRQAAMPQNSPAAPPSSPGPQSGSPTGRSGSQPQASGASPPSAQSDASPAAPRQAQSGQQVTAGQAGGSPAVGSAGSPAGSGPAAAPPQRSTSSSGGHSPFMTAASPAVGAGADQGPVQPGPAQKERIDPDEKYQPPSRDSALLNVVLWGAFGLLVIAALVLALQLIGVVDFVEIVDEFRGTETDSVVVEESPEPVEEELVEEADEEEEPDDHLRSLEQVNQILESAEEDIESNRLSSALERLESAQRIDPDVPRIYELEAEIRETLGEEELAEELRDRAEELRQSPQEGDSPPTPDAETAPDEESD